MEMIYTTNSAMGWRFDVDFWGCGPFHRSSVWSRMNYKSVGPFDLSIQPQWAMARNRLHLWKVHTWAQIIYHACGSFTSMYNQQWNTGHIFRRSQPLNIRWKLNLVSAGHWSVIIHHGTQQFSVPGLNGLIWYIQKEVRPIIVQIRKS